MFKFINLIVSFLRNEIGEVDDAGGDAGQGAGAPADAGQGGAAPADNGGQGDGGEGQGKAPEGGAAPAGDGQGAAPATPKYGEFGDDPNAVYTGYNALKQKTTATERNLNLLRKNLESAGIRFDEKSGKFFKIGGQDQQGGGQQRKTRFTEDHGKLFDPKVLDAIKLVVQDIYDQQFETYSTTQTKQQAWREQNSEAINEMFELYPQLVPSTDKKPNAQFNQAFFDMADELLQTKYSHFPNGELIAAHEAAIRLRINPIAITAAKKEGFDAGKSGKKVLGAARGSGQKSGSSGYTKEQLLAMSPEERAKIEKSGLGK